MKISRTNRLRAAWISAASAAALLAILATFWLAPAADAAVGGYEQVTRLELRYIYDRPLLEARFHLASGLALTQRIEDKTNIDRLFAAADTFAQQKVRMFVTAEEDRVISWHLSIP